MYERGGDFSVQVGNYGRKPVISSAVFSPIKRRRCGEIGKFIKERRRGHSPRVTTYNLEGF